MSTEEKKTRKKKVASPLSGKTEFVIREDGEEIARTTYSNGEVTESVL